MPGKCVRGAVVEVNLDPVVGHETAKRRPWVVIQNGIGNATSYLTIVAVITGAENVPRLYPVNVAVGKGDGKLTNDSVVLRTQVRTVDELRLGRIYGKLSDATMQGVDQAMRIGLAL